jgi:hypothetical protein
MSANTEASKDRWSSHCLGAATGGMGNSDGLDEDSHPTVKILLTLLTTHTAGPRIPSTDPVRIKSPCTTAPGPH